MTNLAWYARNLFLVDRNRKWWQSGLSVGIKAGYYQRIAASYLRMGVTGRKRIQYLGRRFEFDNPATPLNLQVYPYEVSCQILQHVASPRSVATVLDLGGNLGQFSATLKHLLPQAEVDVFEPNPHVLPFLQRNTADFEGVRIFPYALAPRTDSGEDNGASLFFEPNRSCTGSLIAENVGHLVELVEVPIATVPDPVALTGRSAYDLVKIDVEGFELDVVSCLRGISMRYLFLEFSTRARSKSYLHSEMFAVLREQFGEFDILAQDACGSGVNNFDVMIEFAPAAAEVSVPRGRQAAETP
ncbi:FkbM family methyltransferase [Catenulispora yoronensis]|uniref:FkbM family methyltransferase n=1 Tax=Catenulispora yoronensis TaxID=450799 RepID=A0ABP5GP12_9ACTN